MKNIVAVRLEGGIGDHLLGMRVLSFIKKRYPAHKILVYSDCAGNAAQLQVAAMSPHVNSVIPIFQERSRVTMSTLGELTNIDDKYLDVMTKADVFIDGHSKFLFLDASICLDVPYYEILSSRPQLNIRTEDMNRAMEILGAKSGLRYIAINFGKYNAQAWRSNLPNLRRLVFDLLEDHQVYILNMFSRVFDFPHWPDTERMERRKQIIELSEVNAEICEWSDRIFPIVDEKITTVAALLKRCSYFIGVDNGIKHLAWALDIPRTFFFPFVPDREYVLRWIPDSNRMLIAHNKILPVTQVIQAVKKHLNGQEADFG
jgi:Glycosyltransferase family 9 (heptosyltransferase)